MTSVTYHRVGPLIANIETYSVYLNVTVSYGMLDGFPAPIQPPRWETELLMPVILGNPRVKQHTQLDNFLQTLTTSAYLRVLSEYSVPGFTIGTGRHIGHQFLHKDFHFDTPPSMDDMLRLHDDDIRDLLSQAIGNRSLPAASPNLCYMVFVPPRVDVVDPTNPPQPFSGYHYWFSSGSTNIFYAVIKHPATDDFGSSNVYPVSELPPNWNLSPEQLHNFTTIISHELVEAVTDPATETDPATMNEIGTGWHTDPTGSAIGQEIADLCQYDGSLLMGEYALSRFWLASQGGCFNGFLVHIRVVNDGSLPECLGQPLLIEQGPCHLRAEVSNILGTPIGGDRIRFAWTVNGEPAGDPSGTGQDFAFTLPRSPQSITIGVTVTFPPDNIILASPPPDTTTASPQWTFTPLSIEEATNRLRICELVEAMHQNSIIRRWPPVLPVPPLPLSDPVPFVEQEVQELHRLATQLAQATGALLAFYQTRPTGRGTEQEGL